MSLAIFDLDNTLLGGDSDHAWGEFLVQNNFVDPNEYSQKNDQFYQDYQNGNLNMKAYQEFVLGVLKNESMETLSNWHAQFMDSFVSKMILPKGLELIKHHQGIGDQLLIITATNDFITKPIATKLGINEIIATEAEIKDNRYTGHIVGTPSFQEGKIERLNDWLSTKNSSMSNAWFYSDSHNDLPLLKIVDHPVAVDPDDRLRKIAIDKQWKIISLR